MTKHIPPHVAWPIIIVSLLAFGVITTFGMLWFAHSDGGAQVVDRYYSTAVAWDSVASRRAVTNQLGWTLELREQQGGVRLHITPASGDSIDFSGRVRASRPQRAGVEATSEFERIGDGALQRPTFRCCGRGSGTSMSSETDPASRFRIGYASKSRNRREC